MPGPDATAEELLAHAEELSARMSMQGCYVPMPVLSGAGDGDGGEGGMRRSSAMTTMVGLQGYVDALGMGRYEGGVGPEMAPSGFGVGGGFGMGGREEEDGGDGDYIDHLQQPGNTKKRKVPANASSGGGGATGSMRGGGHDDDEDDPGGDTGAVGRDHEDGGRTGEEHVVDNVYQPPARVFPSVMSMLAERKGKKMAAATLAGLQHKEMLKARKRQLAAVLGALSLGDTLALDQALSANYTFGTEGGGGVVKVRLSKRRVVKLARIARRLPRHPDQVPFPVAEFTFVSPSASEW